MAPEEVLSRRLVGRVDVDVDEDELAYAARIRHVNGIVGVMAEPERRCCECAVGDFVVALSMTTTSGATCDKTTKIALQQMQACGQKWLQHNNGEK